MVMDEKVEYFKLPFYKRLSAIFIDFSFAIVLFTFFLIPISNIMSNRIAKNEEIRESMIQMNEILIDSGLFVMGEDGRIVEKINDEAISEGYEFINDPESYLTIKSESDLFSYENGSYIEVGNEEDLNKFYKDNWYVVYQKVVASSEYDKYNQIYIKNMDNYTALTYSINILACASILFIIIPIFNKSGKTIGKMFMKVSVINDYYEKPNKLQVFVRQFFFVLFTFSFIPLLVSFVLTLFTKKGKSLHDLISMTRLIDSGVEKILIEKMKEQDKIDEEKPKDELSF